MKTSPFKPQVDLLLTVLPFVSNEECFALKGGTAINLFVRDLPRLSVDIDLTYLGSEVRVEALVKVHEALHRIKDALEKNVSGVKVRPSRSQGLDGDVKLIIERKGVQIKIEASPVMRGVVLPVEIRTLVPKAVDLFEVEVDTPVVNLGDLYGGKIVAALDRQHPRDLFDVKLLREYEGLTEGIRKGFLTYLLGHPRPFHEVLKPTLVDQRKAFESQFTGMTDIKFEYGEFETVRDHLIKEVREGLSENDKKLLISFTEGNPDWGLAPLPKIKDLPAVAWKLMNIQKMDPDKRIKMVSALKSIFDF